MSATKCVAKSLTTGWRRLDAGKYDYYRNDMLYGYVQKEAAWPNRSARSLLWYAHVLHGKGGNIGGYPTMAAAKKAVMARLGSGKKAPKRKIRRLVTVDTSTLAGLKKAEWYHTHGWRIVESGFWRITFSNM